MIYARAANVADRFALYGPSFEAWTARVEQIVKASAAETGGVRHVRFLTDAACDLVIDRVTLTTTGDDTFDNTVRDLWAQGYNRSDRRYLVYVDANVYCGLGSLLGDDTPAAAGNINNGYGGVTGTIARVDNGCWGLADSIEAHEVMHILGGVQPSAPHATPGYHCADESDRMCGDDGTGVPLRYLCPGSHENTYDCNHDDYFSTNPPPGSYLATHWNVADSVFLGTVDGAATPALTWGFDGYGQLGDGGSSTRVAPGRLSLTGVTAVAAGGFHSLAVVDGRVWAWGLGHVGQLGRLWPGDASSPGVVRGSDGRDRGVGGRVPLLGVEVGRHRVGVGMERLRPVGGRDHRRPLAAGAGGRPDRRDRHLRRFHPQPGPHRRRVGVVVGLQRPRPVGPDGLAAGGGPGRRARARA